MKYMLMFVADQDAFENMPDDQKGALYERIGEWWGTHAAAGRIVGGEQLQGPHTATTVRVSHNGGEPVITDGPFIEAKEGIGGFAIVDVPDLDAALAIAKTWPPGDTIEVRPLVEDAGERMEGHEH